MSPSGKVRRRSGPRCEEKRRRSNDKIEAAGTEDDIRDEVTRWLWKSTNM